ncbi:MAG: DNA transfer protein [Arcobacter butzleri]|nr:DNA transfer protein [Aliarcobacter butzleri]
MKRTVQVNIRLTPEEYDQLLQKSADHGLTMSSYLRNVSMNYPIKCIIDQLAIRSLLNTAGDLGRLGGLFKHWLTQNEDSKINLTTIRDYKEVEKLVEEIKDTQTVLKEKARELLFKV